MPMGREGKIREVVLRHLKHNEPLDCSLDENVQIFAVILVSSAHRLQEIEHF